MSPRSRSLAKAAPPVLAPPGRWIDLVPLSELKAAPVNPKRHDLPGIAESFGEFGYVESVTVDERTGRLVAGHGRVAELRELQASDGPPPDGVVVRNGDWLIPVQRGWSSKDDAQAERYVIATNRLVEKGGWDDPVLVELLAAHVALPAGLTGTGFDASDLARLQMGLPGELSPRLITEALRVDELTINPENLTKHPPRSVDVIRRSLEKFGQQRPILVSLDNVVVAGNGTLLAARELGWKFIDAVRTGLSGAELGAYGLADNVTAKASDLDWQAVSLYVQELQGLSFDLSVLGFADYELAPLLAATAWTPPPATEDEEHHSNAAIVAFKVTLTQAETIRAALGQLRADYGDPEMTDGGGLQLISAFYLERMKGAPS